MISRPGNGQPSMSKLVKHLKILSFRCGNYNFAFICTEQCYEFVSYKFEQPFPSDFLVQIYSVFDFSSYETTSVSTSKTLKKKRGFRPTNEGRNIWEIFADKAPWMSHTRSGICSQWTDRSLIRRRCPRPRSFAKCLESSQKGRESHDEKSFLWIVTDSRQA